MLVSRSRAAKSAVAWASKRLFRRALSTSTSTDPAKFEERPGDIGQTRKSFKQPFLKNLYIGKFDQDILLYPEVVDLDELQSKMVDTVTIEASRDNTVATQSVKDRVDGLFKSKVPLVSDEEICDSERAKIYEMLDIDLQTSLLMDVQTFIISLITKFGSTEQKNKYLPKLLSGEMTGAFAMSESRTGSDPSSLDTKAVFDFKKKTFKLTGTKEWVTNGKNADLFVVVAKNDRMHGRSDTEVTALLVEAKSPGISFSDHNTIQLNDCGICKIHFDDTHVSDADILGEIGKGFDVAASNIIHNRYFIITSLLNTLKKTFREVHAFVITRQQIPVSLKDCELVQYKLSQICTSIYAMESALYLYTGMIDSYDIDVSAEAACLQMFCFQSALEVMSLCNELLGGRSYDGNFDFMKNLSEVQGVVLASKTVTLLKLFMSFTSMTYAAVTIAETIKRNRNPLDYPGFFFRKMLSNYNHQKDSPSLTLKLYENLHPSLKPAAEILEYSVLRLQWAVETFLSRYGKDCANKQLDMCRLANIVTEIFVMTAVIGRASRSYCTGIRFCDAEMMLANSYCREAYHRVRVDMDKIIEGGITSNDVGHLKIGSEIINQGGYFLEHPLVRNIK